MQFCWEQRWGERNACHVIVKKTQKDIRTKTHKDSNNPVCVNKIPQDSNNPVSLSTRLLPGRKMQRKTPVHGHGRNMHAQNWKKGQQQDHYIPMWKKMGEGDWEAPTASHALVDEIIAHPLYNQVALPWSHGLLVYAKDQSLVSFLYSDAS